MLRGVRAVAPGYAGGDVPNPTYYQVVSGTTGHAEVIRFEYDPQVIFYRDLLDVFFATHDPTTINRQGADVGPQYRSVIFYASPEQKIEAEQRIRELNTSDEQGAPIVTRVESLTHFWPAEDYHEKYYENHKEQGYCQIVINPKLQIVKERFARLLEQSTGQS